MKSRIILIILSFGFTMSVFAQKVEYQGKEYLIKGKHIFVDKKDVTNQLSIDDRKDILDAIIKQEQLAKEEEERLKAEKKQEKNEKLQKKAERRVEKAVKKQKKVEKN